MAKGEKKAPRKIVKPKVVKRKIVKPGKAAAPVAAVVRPAPPIALGGSPAVLDRLFDVVVSRKNADPAVSHSARLLSRGRAKVAQKFGEEAVECLIEAVAGNRDALVAESADVLYHLLVMWVDAGIRPDAVWLELQRREGVSGVVEKASRPRDLPALFNVRSTKIP
jgi:phosphoribosyl-ATP pyrophosphohydrolase